MHKIIYTVFWQYMAKSSFQNDIKYWVRWLRISFKYFIFATVTHFLFKSCDIFAAAQSGSNCIFYLGFNRFLMFWNLRKYSLKNVRENIFYLYWKLCKVAKNRRSALGYLLIMLFVKIKVCGKTNISYVWQVLAKKLTPHPHPRQNQLV